MSSSCGHHHPHGDHGGAHGHTHGHGHGHTHGHPPGPDDDTKDDAAAKATSHHHRVEKEVAAAAESKKKCEEDHHHHPHHFHENEYPHPSPPSLATSTCDEDHHNHHHHHEHEHGHEPPPHHQPPPASPSRGAGNGGGGGGGPPLCLAVIRENGTDVVVFDASGIPRTFRYEGDVRTLCFSDHGQSGADGLLTPCLDLHGHHHHPSATKASPGGGDEEEESCFCGIEAPHLHAHVRHPDNCGAGGGKDGDGDGGISRLANQVLLAVPEAGGPETATAAPSSVASSATGRSDDDDGGDDDEGNNNNAAVLHFDVSDRMPKQCNARHVQKGLGDRGLDMMGINRYRRRIHRVRHDDHVDYLVHDAKAGSLHLSHPCHDCGMDDVHGTFTNVATRRLPRTTRRGRNIAKGGHHHHQHPHDHDDNDDNDDVGVQLHFFQVDPARPFSIVEHLQNLFQTHQSDRVSAATHLLGGEGASTATAATTVPVMPPPPPSPARLGGTTGTAAVRSTFACTGICCSSETPVILKLLESVKGVHKVMVNVPIKHVSVDHDPDLVSTSDLAARLTHHGFKATVLADGSASAAAASASALASAAARALTAENGRTVLFVEGICCASEVPTVKSILEPIKGVQTVSVNTTQKLVYVNHSVAYASSQQLADALDAEGFPSEVRQDAGAAVPSSQSAFVRSVLKLTSSADGGGSEPTMEALTALLSQFDGTKVESFVVDLPAGTITVIHNPFVLSAQDVAKALRDGADLDADVLTDGADPKTWSLPAWEDPGGASGADRLDADERRTYPRPNVIICGICWVISMLHYIGGNWEYLTYVGLLAVVIGIPPIAIKTFRTLRRYQFDANALMFFASVGAVALQDYPEAAALVFLFSLSEWLEVRATTRARRALSAIVQLRPDKANLVHPFTKELIVVGAASVPVGALVSVKPGDKVPCDGVVVDGTSSVDESSLTGESRPIRKGEGDEVSGGTVNSGLSTLMVRTTCTADNSAVARLIRLVEEAQMNRSETEKLVDEFAKFYTPVIVLAAIFMVSIPWAFGTEMGRLWTNNGLVLIVVACPCALIISTPVTYVAGLAATARKGVLIKGGAHLEALGFVKRICFDKTGTLTQGSFALLQLQVTSDQLSREQVWEYLTLMEERASHPLAHALLKAAASEKVSIPRDKILQKHVIVEGEGITGVVDEQEVNVGNERMFARLGLLETLSASDKNLVESWKKTGGTVGFMSLEGLGIVCAFCVADRVRPEAIEVIQKLKKSGITTVMLTGDNRQAAEAIGQQVGLAEDDVKASLLPEDKLREVAQYSGMATNVSIIRNPCGSRMLTMMVGDGVNDGPALATADVGVAMGQGAALAMETADVTLLDSNLLKLEFAMSMGRRVLTKIKQNIVFSLAVKFTVLGFALAGRTNLWAAIATDVGAMLLVTLNSMMLLPARQRESDVQALKADIESGAHSHKHDDHGHHHHGASEASAKSSCSKGCCGSASVSGSGSALAGAGGNVSTSSTKGCCTGPTIVAKSELVSSCKKGCCGGSPEPVVVKEGSSSGCKKGSCVSSGDSHTEVPAASCKKGCCGTSGALPKEFPAKERPAKEVPAASCKKGCCGSSDTAPKEVPAASCQKGCCGTSGAPPKEVPAKEVPAASCKKGCCGSSDAAPKEVPAASCKKGCCGTSNAAPKEVPAATCKKGCCGSSSTAAPSVLNEDLASGPKKGCCGGNSSPGVSGTATKVSASPSKACKKSCGGEGGNTAVTDPDTTAKAGLQGKGCCAGIVPKASQPHPSTPSSIANHWLMK